MRIVQLYGTKVKKIYIFVPYIGTKDDKRLILYNSIMNITQEKKSELLHLLKIKKIFGIEHVQSLSIRKEKQRLNQLPIDIESLYDYASNCSLCKLSKVKTSFDFDRGDRKSEIALISLNNNFDNEKEFLSFKIMAEEILHININHIYMTNILKCTVKMNKDNLSTEINQCLNYLEQQIKIIKPKIIITFGFAFNYLMNNNDNIIDVSGNLFEYNGIKIIPLLGLDFINKNPSYEKKMISDLKKLKKIMDEK